MDQYTFKFEINIVGIDLEQFMKILLYHGYKEQAMSVKEQYEKQIQEM